MKDWRRHREYILSLFKNPPNCDLGIDVDRMDKLVLLSVLVGFISYIAVRVSI